MKIAIVGTGYVGLVTGTCFSEMGIDVTCVDIDARKVEALSRGEVAIYEPGLDDMVLRNVEAGRLHFTTDLRSCLADVEVVFSAVGTPPDSSGAADLSQVMAVAKAFGESISRYTLLVTKSTVPVGTARRIEEVVQAELDRRGEQISFDVVSNPEFLKEGTAIEDFMTPDRIIIGTESARARQMMGRLYKPFMTHGDRLIFTDIASAEMIKYAANTMLATRISFMNDIANLCELVGADVDMVRKGMGADSRIGKKFLMPGCGYGGSCFPKDVRALVATARQKGYDMRVLQAVDAVNESQKRVLFDKLATHFGDDLRGRTVAVWGLSFKPGTNDMRESPSLVLIESLLSAGCRVKVYDPVAMEECERIVGDAVEYCRDMYEAATDADALMLVTEWKEFRMPSWSAMQRVMNGRVVFDGRNIYERSELEALGFVYYAIGK